MHFLLKNLLQPVPEPRFGCHQPQRWMVWPFQCFFGGSNYLGGKTLLLIQTLASTYPAGPPKPGLEAGFGGFERPWCVQNPETVSNAACFSSLPLRNSCLLLRKLLPLGDHAVGSGKEWVCGRRLNPALRLIMVLCRN